MNKKVLLMNGPNLNLLGNRETNIYGSESLTSIVQALHEKFAKHKIELLDFQSNSEGALVDFLQTNKDADFVLINPAAYGHTSVALADTLKATQDSLCLRYIFLGSMPETISDTYPIFLLWLKE